MFDAFDVIAFVVFAVLLVVAVTIVVGLGQLPGRIAAKRGHPQAAAVNVASWIGIATLGILWPLALVWAFFKPRSAGPADNPEPLPAPEAKTDLGQMASRITALEATLRALQAEKGVKS